MNDWRQEIADIIKARCTHMDERFTVTPQGCPWCQQTYTKLLAAVDSGLDELISVTVQQNQPSGFDIIKSIQTFKRSVPSE